MTRIAKKFSQYTAIILCIFILLTSVCQLIFHTDSGNKDTQFFAAGFSLFIYPDGRQSLSDRANSQVVSWIRSGEPTADKQSFLVKGNIFSEANKDILSDSILPFDNINQSQGKAKKYYMRI